jgi:hypothetical protein
VQRIPLRPAASQLLQRATYLAETVSFLETLRNAPLVQQLDMLCGHHPSNGGSMGFVRLSRLEAILLSPTSTKIQVKSVAT